MGVRDHRTKDQLQTWTTHRASEPRHARWADRRRARVSKQAKAHDRDAAKREKGGQ